MDALQTSLKVAASGLDAQSRRVLVASENLANANTTGRTPGADPYRRQTVALVNDFDEVMGVSLVRAAPPERDPSDFALERNPSHPAADANGMVKLPNVNMLVEMADIREANRSYEANLQVVKRAREMISMTIDLMRTT
jgi:flagellar basal-body rod protein FlgC